MQQALSGLEGRVVFLAGLHYRVYLAHWLDGRFTVEMPLAGLGIGQQLAWFDERVKTLAAPTLIMKEGE